MDAFLYLEPFDHGIDESYDKMSGAVQLLAAEEKWGDFDSYLSSKEKEVSEDLQQQTPLYPFSTSGFGLLDDVIQLNSTSLPSRQAHKNSATRDSNLTEASDVKPSNPTTLSSLQLLNEYKGCRKLVIQPCAALDDYQRLSAEEVMRVAGAQYINFSIPRDNYNLSMLSSPFACFFPGLTDEETKDIGLTRLLLASAEKIGKQQFNRGSKLLTQCVNLSSDTGRPVQRIVHYFAQALQERIDRETGRFSSKGRWRHASVTDVEETVLSLNPAILDSHKLLPFCQINMFTSVQAIIESIGLVKKVHLIDFGLRSGIPWTMLMQALAARKESPVELLKITAVGTNNKQGIEAAGRMLTCFAQSMGFQFLFNVVMVSNMEDIEKKLFQLEEDESVAVYTGFVLRTMLTSSDRLDSLMRVIKSLNPCIMIVVEVEGNHNSLLFFNRFIECLFYFSAFFDCLETCMDRNSHNRKKLEALYFGEAIVNIVAAEGEERIIRNVGIDVWRSFFARFDMVEKDFSYSSIYQANLIKEQFAHWSSCTTLDMNGKCIIVRWKGTPLESLSAWKFSG